MDNELEVRANQIVTDIDTLLGVGPDEAGKRPEHMGWVETDEGDVEFYMSAEQVDGVLDALQDAARREEHEARIESALDIARRWGGVDGAHHKSWCIDQIVRVLTGCTTAKQKAKDINGVEYEYDDLVACDEYNEWVAETRSGDDGPETYDWDTGIVP